MKETVDNFDEEFEKSLGEYLSTHKEELIETKDFSKTAKYILHKWCENYMGIVFFIEVMRYTIEKIQSDKKQFLKYSKHDKNNMNLFLTNLSRLYYMTENLAVVMYKFMQKL